MTQALPRAAAPPPDVEAPAAVPYGCYRLRRVVWFVWRWQMEREGAPRLETGLTLGRAAARRAGARRLERAMQRF